MERQVVGMKAILGILFACLAVATAEEVVIYTGPEFTTLEDSMGDDAKEPGITFVREFATTEEILQKQPKGERWESVSPLAAEKAIVRARAQVAEDDGRGDPIVTQLRLLRQDGKPFSELNAGVHFYLVEMQLKGNSFERLVLMDGTVVRSRLKRVKKLN